MYKEEDDASPGWLLPEYRRGLVSIVVPTYNRSGLLKECIDSVYTQAYRPIELIIVDDGSSDNTEELVQEYKISDNDNFNIVFFKQKNSGSQAARNKGTSLSKGEFLQYLDSDDLLYNDKLQSQVNYLNHHPQSHGVFGDWNVGSASDNHLEKAFKQNDLIEQFYHRGVSTH